MARRCGKALVAVHADDPRAPELLREASRCEVLGFYAGHPEDVCASRTKNCGGHVVSDEDVNAWTLPLELGAIGDSPSCLRIWADLREAALALKDHASEPGGDGGPSKTCVRCARLSAPRHEQPHADQSVGWHVNLGPRS